MVLSVRRHSARFASLPCTHCHCFIATSSLHTSSVDAQQQDATGHRLAYSPKEVICPTKHSAMFCDQNSDMLEICHRSLRKKYADVSSQVSAMGDISKITAGMVDSVLAEHKLSKDINIVPCSSLTSPHLQVIAGVQLLYQYDLAQQRWFICIQDACSV